MTKGGTSGLGPGKGTKKNINRTGMEDKRNEHVTNERKCESYKNEIIRKNGKHKNKNVLYINSKAKK